ncbi:hypothetical protein BDN72DRAFT_255728 [Pluteus cervinus]|uniref:Uncharacterized protein n=1 Tax=Pluteus cervinus TaxID=181527 RepID=A0ACD3AGS8_9AGAR|nr:hypothetical protein BDN72DRAFT_255728 [Pluteus cervinus]
MCTHRQFIPPHFPPPLSSSAAPPVAPKSVHTRVNGPRFRDYLLRISLSLHTSPRNLIPLLSYLTLSPSAMDKRDKEPKQSELPSTLIPHLYSRPQTPADDAPGPALPAPIPATSSRSDNDNPNRPERPYRRARSPSLTLPPVMPPLATAAPLLEGHRRSRSFFEYDGPSSEPEDTQGRVPGASSIFASSSRLYHHPVVPSSFFQSTGQRFPASIVSDLNYNPPQLPLPSSSDAPTYILPPLTPREATPMRSSWGEGEAGPSSLVLPAQRASRPRRGSSQPARGPLSRQDRFDIDQEGSSAGESAMDREQSRVYWYPPGQSVHGASMCYLM